MIFYYYNLNYKIVIKLNASDYVFEDILFHYNEDKVFYSIVYFLKKHNSVECNYKIYNKKFMIIICAFKK